jgi:hypothetical protein
VGSLRVPLSEYLVELLLLFLPLLLLIIADPLFFHNRQVVLYGAAIIVDAMLLVVGRTRTRRREGCSYRHGGLLDGWASFLGLGTLDIVWVMESYTIT